MGLTLTNFLSKKGIRVLLLEKNKSLSEHSKAITIWPPTQEIFAELGMLQEFEEKSLCYSKLTLHDADQNKPLISFPFEKMADKTPFPRLLILPQYKTEQILYNRLERAGNAKIRFKAEFEGFSQKDDCVITSYSFNGQKTNCKSKFLIGCDGAKSSVREKMGIALLGDTFPFKAALADIRLKTDKRYTSPRISTADNLQIAFHIDKDLWRLITLFTHTRKLSLSDRIKKSIPPLLGTVDHELIWQSEFNLHSRTAEKFAEGRVILAGDAAHLNSPVGGQGMNAGIIDILDLAPALIKSIEKKSIEPIHKYAEKRKESIKEGVNRNTRFITRILLYKKGRYAKTFIRILNHFLKIPFIQRQFLKQMMMLN